MHMYSTIRGEPRERKCPSMDWTMCGLSPRFVPSNVKDQRWDTVCPISSELHPFPLNLHYYFGISDVGIGWGLMGLFVVSSKVPSNKQRQWTNQRLKQYIRHIHGSGNGKWMGSFCDLLAIRIDGEWFVLTEHSWSVYVYCKWHVTNSEFRPYLIRQYHQVINNLYLTLYRNLWQRNICNI